MKRLLPWAVLLLALGVGALLRLWNLGPQVMGDDELHAVRAALSHPLAHILVTYQKVDNTIPLTAFYRVLLDCGLKLSEWTVRLPAVVSGLLLLVLAPLWAARRLGGGTAAVFAALLATAPGLVFYSRIARSYAPIALLGFAALVAFEAWWRRPQSWRLGIAYVALAALAAWFHLGAASFVVAPFLFVAGDLLLRHDRRRLLAALALGIGTLLAFLVFLLPARETLAALVQKKHGELHLSWELSGDVLRLLSGSGHTWVAALFWAAAALGLLRLFRADRRLAALTSTAVLGHVAGLLALAPHRHEQPLIAFRYLLVVLPWVLLWVAALAHRPARPRSWMPAAALVLFLAALSWTGPFADPRIWRSPFAHHDDYLTFMGPRPQLRPDQVPGFYARLADSAEPGVVLEYPWVPVWKVSRAFTLYQEVHGREVVVALARARLADDRLAFRNMVPGTPEGFLASRARWLVVHRNLSQEESRIPPPLEIDPRHRYVFRTFGRRTTGRLTREWGRPDWADRRIAVWDLERVRSHPFDAYRG